jgi:cellobiose phosphorylase
VSGQATPVPWLNVASPSFGTVISESGCGYTWSETWHEFRLTAWNNDPVTDATGEAFYLRDEESGSVWSPTPLPASGKTPYVIRHGFGYSVFEHTENGIISELTVYVAYYDLPNRSEESGTLYEHCVRATQHGLRFGAHGLPLIGSCEWNDGMNLVGKEGRGENVWLAFLFYDGCSINKMM